MTLCGGCARCKDRGYVQREITEAEALRMDMKNIMEYRAYHAYSCGGR